MRQDERVEVVEYTDVMCSWAWGSKPKLRPPGTLAGNLHTRGACA
jgi:hypothetical protein